MGVPKNGIPNAWAEKSKLAARKTAKLTARIATAADLKAERMEGIPNSLATRQKRREFGESDLTT
jgi:hypothetical protein